MSLKWNVPIFMVRLERINMFNFRMTIEDKIKISKTKDHEKNVYKLTEIISHRIEEWIIERPEQWLWAHRRWGNSYFSKILTFAIPSMNFTLASSFIFISSIRLITLFFLS